MRQSHLDLILMLLFCSLKVVSHSYADEKPSADKIASFHEPIRFEDLDSISILPGLTKKNPFPIIYPAEFSLYDLLDFANPSFQSLEELKKIPVKNNFVNKQSTKKTRHLKKISKDDNVGVTKHDSSPSITDPVVQFVQSSAPNSLPSDDEIESFLLNKESKKNEDLNPQDVGHAEVSMSKTFVEFRKEAESSLLSRIFNRSSENKSESLTFSNQTKLTNPNQSQRTHSPVFFEDKTLHNVISSTVKLRAKKPNIEGQLEPAQASEFYLTTQNLNDLLQDMETGPAVEGELKSVAEIWAKAEKNSSLAPEVALSVKSILLEAKVSKARTDPFGEAALLGVQPDEKYFLIGIDKDFESNVVTIWSKEVKVQPGENMVELTSSDVIYQE